MKLNGNETKTIIVLRSHRMHPQSPPLTLGGIVLKEFVVLDILGVIFHSKRAFEKHRSVSRAALEHFVSKENSSDYFRMDS